MSMAGVAAQEIRVPLKTGFLHDGQALGSLKACWGGRGEFENDFLNIDPITMAYSLNSTAEHLTSIGRASRSAPMNGSHFPEHGPSAKSRLPPLIIPPSEGWGQQEEGRVACGLKKLAVNGVCASTPPLTPIKTPPSLFPGVAPCERGSRPLPPLPISEDLSLDETDCEVEFLTSSDTDFLLEDCAISEFRADGPGRRSFRGCGQINYAYFDTPAVSAADLSQAHDQAAEGTSANPPLPQAHRRLRRSHSGPAGSFNKPAIRISSYVHRASPNSDDDKPEVPPRVPIPPRPAKPDYRRWSAEVTSSTYSDEDRPPKVPPREPLSRSNSRTPSPKSLPSYLNGVMPPTQSFAPDPKYVSSKALQRQHSEGATGKVPCILPIIENGKKVSSTHYYLLPERPPYLDKYEKFFREAEETHASTPIQPFPADGGVFSAPEKLDLRPRVDLAGHVKRRHFSYVVSP
ncbi:ERBB receptor feedback inhibitor 1 [Phocoena sinus]|uniref:ERBB receptor feedback inhibitor 1 n=1 Tax=Phocoena sinus TaxID=42100 RepID=A0A8C9BYE0_PHOSS|nr:ERBB receptor feedback inhibitor 1 [Phocoena sinus]XP_032492969.1 ERBB receptor feedback inhibitor 1 [Phocoena sinus]XP_032492978.1 ERBB receptor feedback inhibitor 1 [Phocoena sinus]XP_032492986.1 ERBB receptor feedback inhibitor 1 [Phocoena sinus]XP_032492996.1 ERBB receptor feedback inhibitor 1 [Phocoena sinus]XP_032493007.1 ERBB receptor feedback inhibitor 1 [Phocoena sinus]XP_032493017.1 ERBB receptor feedback inhibitor 1 [Phocoena sinus]XP_032493026.1 ERBB receptor feedback inhibito